MLRFIVILVIGVFMRQTCADVTEMIVGGTPALLVEFPYQCSLIKHGNYSCGCSIINAVQILTAAHCVYNVQAPYSNLSIITGSIESRTGTKHAVKTIRIHSDFMPDMKYSLVNDIAVITLNKAIKFNRYQSSIAPATTAPVGGIHCVMAGLGRIRAKGLVSGTLLKINTLLVDKKTCQSKIQISLFDGHICAFNKQGIGACNGDSGGPLVCNGQQVGIASFSRPCATGEPDIFTDVFYHKDFIKQARADTYRFF